MRIHFACIYHYPLFASEQTFARIDFLRSGGRLVDYKGTHNVKILTENRQKVVDGRGDKEVRWAVDKLTI